MGWAASRLFCGADTSKGRRQASSELTAAPPPSICPINQAEPGSPPLKYASRYSEAVEAAAPFGLAAKGNKPNDPPVSSDDLLRRNALKTRKYR